MVGFESIPIDRDAVHEAVRATGSAVERFRLASGADSPADLGAGVLRAFSALVHDGAALSGWCCQPVRQDDAVTLITTGAVVSVHRLEGIGPEVDPLEEITVAAEQADELGALPALRADVWTGASHRSHKGRYFGQTTVSVHQSGPGRPRSGDPLAFQPHKPHRRTTCHRLRPHRFELRRPHLPRRRSRLTNWRQHHDNDLRRLRTRPGGGARSHGEKSGRQVAKMAMPPSL